MPDIKKPEIVCSFCTAERDNLYPERTSSPFQDQWLGHEGIWICPTCQHQIIMRVLKGEKVDAINS